MSVDLEDYYCDLPFEEWKNHSSRVVETTNSILELFDKYKVDIRKLNQEEFELDLVKSIKTLENISKEKILGFRAPFFLVDKQTLWVYKKLRKYFKYDSSIFPTRTPLYGIPDAIRRPYYSSNSNPLLEDEDSDFLEIPLATFHLPILGNIPIAGGFHLRFLPLSIINSGIKKLNKSKIPAMCYIHPKDIDPYTPHLSQYNWTYYWKLASGFKKFESLLKNFLFSSARQVFQL